jgi:uncharacterized membrane protein (UPF0127 family)
MFCSAAIAAVNRTRGICLAENVRVARTHWTRLRGLIGTEKSAFQPGQALWIVPCRGVHTLAMHFSLDVVYLDQSGYVVDLQAEMKPWRFAPVHLRAASVLELPSGVIQRSGTVIGDQIEIVQAKQPEELAA